jgi:AcrR family transcriptional regulator
MLTRMAELPVLQPEPLTLPLADAPPERADAARNREKILGAAARLFAERCPSEVRMDDVAKAAGVGKGTLFRRFGDRAGLVRAIVEENERALQERMIRGEPPLGPGAAPLHRLCAFGDAYLDFLEAHHELLALAEMGVDAGVDGGFAFGPYGFYSTHIGLLLREAGIEPSRVAYLADALMGPLTATGFRRLRLGRGLTPDAMRAGYHDLLGRVVSSSG